LQVQDHRIVRRITAILMVLCYVALGSGAMERLHNAQHAAEDAKIAAAFDSGKVVPPHAGDHHPSPIHDESNCPVHAQLHLAGLAVAWVPLLICLGLFVAFLTLLPPCPPARQVVFAIACRGPPFL
jgi:hypothetical protein